MKPNEFFLKRFGIMEESKNDKELMSDLLGCIAEDCGGCPYKTDACKTGLLMDVNNLIERQKAEIERLTQENNALNGNTEKYIKECENRSQQIAEGYRKEIKSEAVREFAEKLKKFFTENFNSTGFEDFLACFICTAIDELVEEMGCNDEL